jgi:hypothetical protein
VKVFRLRRLNAAEAAVSQASELLSLVQREGQPELREQHHSQLPRARRRSRKNLVASQQEDSVRSQIVRKDKFRRGLTSKDLSVSGSVRLRLWARVNASSAAKTRHLDSGNRSRRLLVADLRARRAPNEKERRAHTVSRRLNNSSLSYSSSNNSEAAWLREPGVDRCKVGGKDSRKVERRKHQKKRHRQDRDNFDRNKTSAAPEPEGPEPLCFLL